MVQRYYSSTSPVMALTSAASSTALTINVNTISGLPPLTPFTLVVDPGSTTEEVITVNQVSGLVLTVVRGEDGSATQSHATGAIVRHMMTARDLREPQQHIAAATDVHGVGAGVSVVGTSTAQTLTGKSMSGLVNTFTNVPQSAVVGLATTLATYASADSTEVTLRTAADATLQTNLNTETTARAAADTAEVSARASADTGLSNRVGSIEATRLLTLVGTGNALVGALPGSGNLIVKAGTQVGLSDASGYVGINYPTPFPGGVLSVLIGGGDITSNPGILFMLGWAGTPAYTTNRFVYGVSRASDATLLPNYNHRINWIAIGW